MGPLPFPSVSTVTSAFVPRELQLLAAREPPRRPLPEPDAPWRLGEALRRWLEEEL
ncbi:MAG TPA: hypothetical protein VFR85_12915 [Anaeromyxobacteraceae bacterium]|nr:hypothetical protein [Anaeromyxobacteraceae bacterium]